ncbi:uncharacterized protein DDB_G0271670-like isoform X1 [Engraulis encrasicolus]|uniref:uncharacterized protein DDB_G0271670-like isoform X1 n=1 Tax=Engraulis encrasicolus TaxID=184585 RepID=UPI002FD55D27
MMQRNMCPGTTRRPLAVRRRPKFISAKDVQTAKTRRRRGCASSQPGRAVTGVKTMEFYSSALPQSHSSTPIAPCITVASALQTLTVSTPTSSYVTPPPAMTLPPFVSPPPAQTSGNVTTAHMLTPTPLASRQLSSEVNVSSPSTKLHTGSSLSSVTSPSRDLSVDDLFSDRHQVISPSSKSSDPAQVLPAASAVSTAKPSTPVPTSSRSTSGSSASASSHPSQTAQIKHGGLTLTTSIDDLRALVDSDLVLTSPNYVTNPFSHPLSAKCSDPAQVLPAASAVPTAKPSTPVPTSSRSTSGSSALAGSHPSQTAQTKHTDQSVDDLLLDLDQLISPTHVTNPSSHALSAHVTNPSSHALSAHVTNPFSHPQSTHVTNPSSHPQSAKSSDPAQVSPAASTVPTIKCQAPVPPPSSKSTSGSSISSSSHTNNRLSISVSSGSPSSHLSQTAQTKYRDPSDDDNWLLVDPSAVPKTRSLAPSDPLRSTASKQRAAAASRAQFSSVLESSLYASTAGSAAAPVPPRSRRMSPPPPHMSTTTTSFSASSSSSSSPVFCYASPTPPPKKDKCILL